MSLCLSRPLFSMPLPREASPPVYFRTKHAEGSRRTGKSPFLLHSSAPFTITACKYSITAMASSVAPTNEKLEDDDDDDVSSLATILEPVRKEGINVFFFFLPGAHMASHDYLPLLNKVQSKCSLRLWVAILDPGSKPWVSTAMIEASFDGVLERVKQLGFPAGSYPSKNIVFGGHSWGAWESRSIALKRAEAFIQLGSFFDNLMQYPKPVLTMTGGLDGQIMNAAIVKHAGQVYAKRDELGDFFVHAMKPVILVTGMNHAQFSHGIPNKERGDFDAEISDEQARDVSSDLLSAFIMAHMSGPAEDAVSSSVAVLREAVSQTWKRYKVFWEAIENPARDAKKMQLELAALPAFTEDNIGVVHHDHRDNFIFSKPLIDATSQRIIITTFCSPVGKYNLLSNIWVKFKSREALATVFNNGKIPQGPLPNGAYFNEKTFTQALALVPEVVRKKFEERGKKLRFLEDVVVKTSAQDWIDSDLMMKAADDGTEFVDVQSTSMITPLHGLPDRFAGMHYIKLLTAARALSWIYEDSFR